MTKNYIKKGKMPEFTGDLAKQKDHWNAFVAYKSSELGWPADYKRPYKQLAKAHSSPIEKRTN